MPGSNALQIARLRRLHLPSERYRTQRTRVTAARGCSLCSRSRMFATACRTVGRAMICAMRRVARRVRMASQQRCMRRRCSYAEREGSRWRQRSPGWCAWLDKYRGMGQMGMPTWPVTGSWRFAGHGLKWHHQVPLRAGRSSLVPWRLKIRRKTCRHRGFSVRGERAARDQVFAVSARRRLSPVLRDGRGALRRAGGSARSTRTLGICSIYSEQRAC